MTNFFFSLPQEKKDELRMKFEANIDKNGPNGCWIWTGTKYPQRYGRLCIKDIRYPALQKMAYIGAHRLAWILRYNSDIPKGLHCCHTCDVRECANPDHIFLGTPRHNKQDLYLKDKVYRLKLVQRLEIAEKVINGMSWSQAAKLANMSIHAVSNAMRCKEVIAKYGRIDVRHRAGYGSLYRKKG